MACQEPTMMTFITSGPAKNQNICSHLISSNLFSNDDNFPVEWCHRWSRELPLLPSIALEAGADGSTSNLLPSCPILLCNWFWRSNTSSISATWAHNLIHQQFSMRNWLLVDGARKEFVACSWMTSPLGTPRGRCDEYSSKIFPQLRNQGLSIRRGETNDWRWCLQASRQLWTIYMAPRPSFALRAATWNLHTHNQVLCSQLAMRLSISPVCLKQRVWAYRVESDNSMRVK
jgi:hypothetical protein